MSRYIDADRLKKELDKSGYCYNQWLGVEGIIDSQPTADVRENVRGEWIKDYRNLLGYQIPRKKCSVCGAIVADVSDYRFCPNCGADMRGES